MTHDPHDAHDSDEPTPWSLGVVVGMLSAAFVSCVLIGLYDVVAQTHVLLGVGAALLVCGGVAPTAWTWRRRSVLRWISWGSMAGLAVGLTVVVGLAATVPS